MIEPVGRPAGDVLSRSVRLRFGEQEYVLPVLTIAGNRRWKAEINRELAAIFTALRKSGMRSPQLYDVLAGQVDQMIALLRSYDTTHVLPDNLEEIAYESDLIPAIQEVWLAANPLVATALEAWKTVGAPTNDSSAPTSSPPPNGAGSPAMSSN